MANSAFSRAKATKRDEFYTRLEDVEQELDHYRDHFEGKVIYLNCDDPEVSAFWQYFSYNFEFFGLKKLMATHYVSDGGSSYKHELEGYYKNHPIVVKSELEGNGDFRSEECIELLKEADIVITNPPFSLWREYVAQLVRYDKKFIIIGNMNAVTYKEVFPLFKDDKIWFGHRPMSSPLFFEVPDDYEYERVDEDGRKLKSMNACWYTNLETNKHHKDLALTRFYEGNEDHYPKYDNYEAIEVGRVKEIPMDYTGVMGVPITFMDKHNPEQFEILGSQRWAKSDKLMEVYTGDSVPPESDRKTLIDGRETYDRIFIINKKPITKEELSLTRFYKGNEEYYPKYDNYDAIEVSKVKEIPMDYTGVMGVPITYLGKHDPEQFDIIGITDGGIEFEDPRSWPSKKYVNAIQHNKDGSTTNGSKTNNRSAILLDEVPDDAVYYTADNADGPLRMVYARILIVNKKPVR